MLNGGAVTAVAVPRRPLWKTTCLASNVNTEQLRAQLDQLRFEAETTRNKGTYTSFCTVFIVFDLNLLCPFAHTNPYLVLCVRSIEKLKLLLIGLVSRRLFAKQVESANVYAWLWKKLVSKFTGSSLTT